MFTTEIRDNLNVYEEIDKDVIHICIYTHTHIYIHIYIHIHTYIYTYICTYICTNIYIYSVYIWSPWWLSCKELTFKAGDCLQCRRHQFDLWVLIKKIPWRRKWQPTPVFLPGEFHGQRSLAGTVHGVTRVGHDLATKSPPYMYIHTIKMNTLPFAIR